MKRDSQQIVVYISKANDWRGALLQKIRTLIHEVEPEIKEEWKWNSPVYSLKGKLVCGTSAFKKHVSLNFFYGAFLEDPGGLFPKDAQAKQMRTIKYMESNIYDEAALKVLLSHAMQYLDK